MHSNVMLRLMVQALQHPPLCSSIIEGQMKTEKGPKGRQLIKWQIGLFLFLFGPILPKIDKGIQEIYNGRGPVFSAVNVLTPTSSKLFMVE
jgi:hypothetical protein